MANTAAVLQILVNAQTGGAVAQITALEGKLKQTTATANKSTGVMGKFGTVAKTGAAVGVVALGYALLKSSQKAADFEKKMSSLSAVTSASRKEMKKLEEQAMRMGAATTYSASEAADAQIELAKGGLKVKQILGGGLNSALALAAAGELDLGLAASTTVNAMKLFQIEGKKSMQVADMLATAANTTTADVSDFAMALTQGGAVAKQVGYSLNDTVTVLEALAEAGVKNSDAGTSMKAAFIQLLKPSEKQAAAADALGISWTKQNGEMKSAAQISDELRAATEGMTKAERGKTFALLAGTDGFRTLAALYDAGAGKLNRLSAANEKQGTAAEVARKKNNNLRGDLERARGAFESLQILIGKKVNPTLREVTKWVAKATSTLVALVQGGERAKKALDRFERANRGLVAALRILWNVIKTVISIFKLLVSLFTDTKSSLKNLMAVVRNVGEGMKSVFSGAWLAIQTTFRDGANAVIDTVNAIIDVLNKIPGVNIDGVENIAGPHGDMRNPGGGKGAGGHQRGAFITGGKPSGDSIPAMLERGEYVLNRNAVKKVGVERLNDLNFKAASRFQTGGPVGLINGGDVWDAAKGAAGAVAGKGAGFFMDKLPKPNIPEPFTGVGPYVIKKAIEYIKDKANPFSGGGSLKGGGDIVAVGRMLQGMGYEIGEHPAFGGVQPVHSANSAHYSGRAFDVNDDIAPRGGSEMASLDWLAPRLQKLPHSQIIWRNQDIDTGAAIPDHMDHLHFAMQRGGFLGRHIRRLMVGGAAEHGVVKRVGADLLSHGFDFKSTAGILGNAWREGLWNPSQMEMTGMDNGGLWGFTASPKSMPELRAYASSVGKPWDDPIVQTHFMMRSGGASIKGGLNAQDTIAGATKYFMDKYEIPASATAALDIRTSAAFDAAKILRDAGITKPGDEAGGDTGPSAAERKKSAREDRKAKRSGIIGKLMDSLKGKVGGDRLPDLWKIIGAYAKFGKFEGSEKSMLLGQAGAAARAKSPVVAANGLDRLRLMLGDLVEVSGEPGTNESLVKRLKDIKAKGLAASSDKRDTIISKIRKNGMNYMFKDKLLGVDGIIASLDERRDIAEQLASFEGGPGGSDLTEGEKAEQIALNTSILGKQGQKNTWLMKAIAALYGKETNLGDQIYAARPKTSTTHWKLPSLKKAAKDTRDKINELTGNRISLTGLTGRGGEIFDTQMRLKGLGVASTVESAAAASRDSELASLMREQLSLANRNNAILSAQMPIYTQFMPKYHTGGVIPGAGEQPIMAMGGEGVFTRDQMAAMGGSAPVITLVIEEGAGIDASKIRAEVNGELTRLVTKQRTGNYGPKYTTAGRA